MTQPKRPGHGGSEGNEVSSPERDGRLKGRGMGKREPPSLTKILKKLDLTAPKASRPQFDKDEREGSRRGHKDLTFAVARIKSCSPPSRAYIPQTYISRIESRRRTYQTGPPTRREPTNTTHNPRAHARKLINSSDSGKRTSPNISHHTTSNHAVRKLDFGSDRMLESHLSSKNTAI